MNTPQTFEHWARWFREFQDRQLPVPWDDPGRISPDLRSLIGDSVRQFQLGESSEARHLKAKVARWCGRGGEPAYGEAIEWFIHEENRHSRLLGRFLDLEGLPRAQKHWSDTAFRRLRHSFGLRHALILLLSAELVAVPYYQALQKISDSAILTTICKQILLDENLHIRFQADAIRQMRATRRFGTRLDKLFARTCLEAAVDVVWFSHGELLMAAGYNHRALRQASLAQYHKAWAMILGETTTAIPANPQQTRPGISELSQPRLRRQTLKT